MATDDTRELRDRPPPTATADFSRRALALFPAGSNGEYNIPPELIPIIDRGAGCRVWDTAGREFLDMTMAWGSAIAGHAHPAILEATARAAAEGANFAALNRRAVQLAERIQSLSPAAERIRLVASGTEATLLCLRIAHTATGRPKILKFEGAYHGQHPVGVAAMLSPAQGPQGRIEQAPRADASGAGAPWIADHLLAAPFNDLETTRAIIESHAHEIAGVIVEPLHRCLPPKPGFLEGLRALTQRSGIVLIFDEVVTGFRLALGGAQEYYGVRADLVAYGKALGGGFPIGACAGRPDLLEIVAEHRSPGPAYVWSASTSGGNPVSCAAALATLDLLAQPGAMERLHAAGHRLRSGLLDLCSALGESAVVLGDGPLAQIAFSAAPVHDQQSWLASDRARARAWMLELLRRGVFLNPMGTKLYLSLAHGDQAIREFIDHAGAALKTTRRASPL